MTTDFPVFSPYMDNTSETVLEAQRRVFKYLDIPLRQVQITDGEHGDWIDSHVRASDQDVVIICDIDAFPITRDAYEQSIHVAMERKIFGLAQVANHKNPEHIYAGPMFMSFAKKTYTALDQPCMKRTKNFDAAQELSFAASKANVEIVLAYPNAVMQPKWPLADQTVFGIGTFYGGNAFFHLFQSRQLRNIALFEAVAEDVVAGAGLKFERYLNLLSDDPSPSGWKRILGLKK